LASAARDEGRPLEALRQWVRAWRFQARLTPAILFPDLFDERGVDEVNETLAREWRRLVLHGPRLPAGDARAVLADLTAVTNALNPPAWAYAQAASERLRSQDQVRQGAWREARLAFADALGTMAQDARVQWRRMRDRLMGVPSYWRLSSQGLGEFARPLAALVAALQQSVARPNDIRRAQTAVLSQELAQLIRHPQFPVAARANPRTLAPERTWIRTWLDRPAAWQAAAEAAPGTQGLQETYAWWLVYWESCRIALALRLYWDEHGAWPERLGQLCPGIFPAEPLDPFTGQPFRYERTGDGWRFWSLGPSGQDPLPSEQMAAPQREFRSADP
jgi:hypothetical protein